MTFTRRVITIAALAVVAVAATAAPAFAHASLGNTDPLANEVVSESPKAVTLTFDEHVEASLGAIRAFDDRGRRLDVGNPTHPGGDKSVVQAAVPDLRDGTYVVTWRVTSEDAHPIRGAFTFSVGTASTSNITAQNLAARLLTDEGGSTVVGVIYAAARVIVFAGLALLFGGVAFLVAVWPAGRGSARARRIVWVGWWMMFGATLVAFVSQGAYAGALPLADVVKPSLWSDVWDTRFGQVMVLRLALLVVAIPILRMLLPRRGPALEHPLPGWWPAAAGVLGVAIAATPGLAGHASTGPWSPVALVIDTLHVLAMGTWVGGLVVLFAALLPGADEPTLRRAVPRYSRLALVSAGLVILTGIVQSLRQVDRIGALVDTDFGRILLVKVIIVLMLIVVAAVSRDVVDRRWRVPEDVLLRESVAVGAVSGSGASSAALVGAGGGSGELVGGAPVTAGGGGLGDGPAPTGRDPHRDEDEAEDEYPEGYVLDEQTAVRRLKRSVIVEMVLVVAVLIATALLVNAAPARSTDSGPYFSTLKDGGIAVDVAISPAQRGPNELHLYALTPGGVPADVVDMTAELTQPEKNIAPIEIALIRAAPGHYTSESFTVPFRGDWTLTIKALVTDVKEARLTDTVPIR